MSAGETTSERIARYEQYLSTSHLGKNLKRSSVRGGIAMVGATTATFIIGLAGTAVTARLLPPRDFGLLAMVATLTRLVEQFKDMGLAMATVQRSQITHQQVSYLFWVNTAIGVVAALFTALSAPLLAWFYGEPELNLITLALATAFAVSGIGVQHQALLQRRLQYRSIAVLRVLATGLGTAAGVLAAMGGWGYWSLVVMQLGTAAAQSALGWLFSPWRPTWVGDDVPDKRSLVAFGGQITAARFLVFITRNLDNVLIGKVWGDEALGLYAKAYQILMLPVQRLINPLTSVVVPALSRLQNDQRAYISYYQKALRTLSTLSMPVVVLCFIAAPELIGVVLGENWTGAVRIFQYLAPAAFAGSLNPTAWAWISLDQADRMLRWNMIATPVNVAAFVVGVPFGPEGVAIAFSAVQLVLRYFSVWYCFRGNFLSMGVLMAAVWHPTVAALAAGVLVWASASALVPPLPLPLLFALKGAYYTLVYLGIWLLLPGGAGALRETALLVREIRGKRKS